MSGCMLRFNELWQVSLCCNMGSSGFWLVGPAKCGFIGTMWKETATVDSSCVTNPLNENLVSIGPVSLWQAWINPNLPSTWGFPECTHPTRVWSQPASSPQWGASLVLICEVCQDLPSHNMASEWITPSVNELNLLLLLLNIAVRGVCVCSVHNWIRLSAADVACQLYLYEQHFIDWEYFMYNEQIIWTDWVKGFKLNCFRTCIAKVIINNNQVYLLETS